MAIGCDRLRATRPARRRRVVGTTLLALALVSTFLLASPLLAGGGRLIPFEERFIFFPSPSLVATPAEVGLPHEDVWFGEEGRLHGWFVPGSSGVTLLWFHGNAGNVSHRVDLMRRLHGTLGASIFIFDYQGYGQSRGKPSEAALTADARAALAYLERRPDVDPSRIVYFGKSIGAAVAIELATVAPPSRLVVQSAFTSIPDMGRLHYPFLPIGKWLATRFPNLERIGHVRAPILIVHGDRDDVAPLEHARRLYEAADEPKRILVVAGAGHNDVIQVGGRAYLETFERFLGEDRGA